MNEPTVRLLESADFVDAQALYGALVGPEIDVGGCAEFDAVLAHPGTQIWGAFEGGVLTSMVTLHVLPDMTFRARPYAVIENVVTRPDRQGCGFGRRAMEAALAAAWKADAYKVMLLTGKTLQAKGFYERLGFTSDEKHAMTKRRVPVRPAKATGSPPGS